MASAVFFSFAAGLEPQEGSASIGTTKCGMVELVEGCAGIGSEDDAEAVEGVEGYQGNGRYRYLRSGLPSTYPYLNLGRMITAAIADSNPMP